MEYWSRYVPQCCHQHGRLDPDNLTVSVWATNLTMPCLSDLIRCIEDPEKAASLEDLGVVSEDDVSVSRFPGVAGAYYVRVQLTPTVPHCSLATLIGLCVRVRLQENLDFEHKLDIILKEGSHQTSDEGK